MLCYLGKNASSEKWRNVVIMCARTRVPVGSVFVSEVIRVRIRMLSYFVLDLVFR
jgi:hypothetical protein